MARLQIRGLGTFDVRVDGNTISWFPTEQVRALLLILASSPGFTQQRASLASILWSDVDDGMARRNLRRCLFRLKEVLGDEAQVIIEASRSAITLVSAESDILNFQTLSTSDNPSNWHQAVDLLNGEFAEGFHLKNSPLFETWLADQRLALRQQRYDLLKKLLDTSASDPAARLTYAQQLAVSEPYDDVAHQQIMLAHADMGNVLAAIAHYDQYAALLQEQLYAEPESETQALRDRLLASLSSRPAELHNVPAQLTQFVGRKAELNAVLNQIQQPECRMVTLLGAGGVGKTRLALEVAQRQTSELFADGVYFVPLVTATTAFDVLVELHRVLELRTQDDDLETQLFNYLRDKQLLLVLDNVEQLGGELRFLAKLLQSAAGVKLLVTSRDVVGISAEHRFPVSGIVDLHEASSLLWSAIKRIAPDFEQTPANIAIGARICEHLGGVPLALELAATWINTLELASIREEIEHAYTFLESPLLDTPERHRSLGAIFDHSWDLLTPKHQKMLAKASIFRGGFEMKAARAVLGAGMHDLRRLVEQSLLSKGEQNRYSLHELVRQFATERVPAADESAIRQAHANYYLAVMAENEPKLVSEEARATSKLLSNDLPNITAAWRWAVAQNMPAKLASAVTSMTHFYRLTGRFAEGDQLYVETIERLGPRVDAHLLAQLHIGCAHFRMWQSRHEAGIDSAELALAAAQRTEDGNLIAESQLAIGRSLRALGKVMRAIPIFQQGLAACEGEALTTRALRAEILANLALILSFGVDVYAGHEMAAKALVEAEQSGNKMAEALVLSIASYTNIRVERLSPALNMARDGIALGRKMGYAIFEASCQGNLGRVQVMLGLYDEAETNLREAQEIYRSIGDNLGEIHVLSAMIRSQYDQGNYAKTFDYAEQLIALSTTKGIALHQGHALYWKGISLLHMGALDAAEAVYEQLRQKRKTLNLGQVFSGHYLYGLGAIALARGSAEKGRDIISSKVDAEMKRVSDPVHLVKNCLLGYAILTAAHDTRAQKFLKVGYDHIMQAAAAIENPIHRQSYLDKAGRNRELIELYESLDQ